MPNENIIILILLLFFLLIFTLISFKLQPSLLLTKFKILLIYLYDLLEECNLLFFILL